MSRRVMVVVALVLVAACEQQGQSLPFEAGASVSRTITAEGGTVSTPAGAAVHFPTGALPGDVNVTLSAAALPTGLTGIGVAASQAFALEPAGIPLEAPAEVQLKLGAGVESGSAWQATVVSVAEGGVRVYPAGRVDLGTGLASAKIDRLGTLVAVIPTAGVTFPVDALPATPKFALLPKPRTSAFLGVDAASLSVSCGPTADPCTDVEVTATQNLLDLVADAALIYPSATGTLQIGSATVTGEIRVSAFLRVLLESGRTAETIGVNALLTPTAGSTVIETETEIRISNVRYQISGAGGENSGVFEQITTLVVPRTTTGGTLTIERTFDIATVDGPSQPATVAVSFPVVIH